MVFTIQEVNYGIASRIGNDIFINKKIRDFDIELYWALLEHEQTHTDNYSWKDFKMDLNNEQLKNKKREYYKFILTHPSSWVEYLPVQFFKGQMVINPSLVIMYLIITLIFFGGAILRWFG